MVEEDMRRRCCVAVSAWPAVGTHCIFVILHVVLLSSRLSMITAIHEIHWTIHETKILPYTGG